ncbi:MAG: thioether cross-link-forming SCIFF peptide maturase [Ruminococcaceae bacterium]|nr:thioether cross-link-forming SCIFF peptide maturase [Oscillospiraceae bacterium]
MIHKYKLGGYNIVLDISSGSVHVVDNVAYDIIDIFEDNDKNTIIEKISEKYADNKDITKNDIEECYLQIEELKNNGQLFAPDTFEDKAGHLKQKTSGVIKALCLHVAHTCNLNCSYCFASQGKYHGERDVMSFEVGKRALDFLVENSGTRKNLEVDFFGGEPLMNFDVVKKLVEYARSIEKEKNKNFRFTLTTNGVLVDDDVIEFANKEMSNVVLSLDGRKEVHDRYRVDYNGNGSWDKIVPKFQKFVTLRGGKNYYMRGTFTHANPDFLEDIKKMLELGFYELSMEPVVCAPGDKEELTEEDLPIVLDQYEKLANLMIEYDKKGTPFTFYHYMIDLEDGPCIYKRISGCGSGTEYMAVTPWGDLYPCHQFVGEEKFKLGDIYNGVTNTKIQQSFSDCNVYARPDCKDCWAKLYCSGGCSANAYHSTGSVKGVYKYGCELFKKRMECAIMVAISRAFSEEE